MNATALLDRIDIHQFAGVHSMLGIEVTANDLKIVELGKEGSAFNRFNAGFSVENSFAFSLDGETTIDSRSSALRTALADHQLSAQKAVIGMGNHAVRTIEALIPKGHDINDWISENHEKLIKLPVPLAEFSYVYTIIEEGEHGRKVLVSFARTSLLMQAKGVISGAGMEIVGVTTSEFRNRKAFDADIKLDPQFVPGAHLALRGFFPEINPIEFLNHNEQQTVRASLYKRLFHRSVLSAGLLLMTLLLVPFTLSFYFQSRSDISEERLLALGPEYSEVKSLEHQVSQLSNQISGGPNAAGRSNAAKVLYELASAAPDGLWLATLEMKEKGKGYDVALSGYARGNAEIARFLKTMEESGPFADVRLLRTGTAEEQAGIVSVRNVSKSFVAFEMTVSAFM